MKVYFSKRIFLILGILFLSSFQTSIVWAADSLNTPEGTNEIFHKAFFLNNTGRTDEALQEFRRIANEKKGTGIGACALLWMAGLHTSQQEKAAYEEVIADYPNTRYWLVAKLGLINRKYYLLTEYDKILREEDKVIKSIGGVGIYDFFDEKLDFNRSDVSRIYHNDLANYYQEKIICYESPRINKTMKIDLRKSIRLLCFLRENFPKYSWDNIPTMIRLRVLKLRKVYGDLPKDTRPPTVWIIQPRPKVLLFRRRPWIYVKMFDGDISQSQIDLPKLVFTLDGQDLTNDMKVRSKINKSGRVHKRRPWKHPFEVLKIRYRPKHKLSPGKHTIYIKVPDGLGHVTEKTWTFRVKKGCRHPDDDKNDDEVRPEE